MQLSSYRIIKTFINLATFWLVKESVHNSNPGEWTVVYPQIQWAKATGVNKV